MNARLEDWVRQLANDTRTAMEQIENFNGSDLPDGAWDWFTEHIEDPLMRLICETKGHVVVLDHCGLPEHDRCYHCGQRFPGEAEERQRLANDGR